MRVIYVGILAVTALFLIGTRKEPIAEEWKPDVMYRIFLRPASWLERRLGGLQKGKGRENASKIRLREDMKILYPSNAQEMLRRYRVERISILLCFCVLGTACGLAVSAAAVMDGHMTREGWIRRNSYGEGSTEILLQADTGERNSRMQIKVEERKYTREELEGMRQELREVLEDGLKGDNVSLDEVRSDLHLPSQVAGYPFRITWESGNYARIRNDGSVENEGSEEDGEIVWMTATLSYFEERWEERFALRVCPPRLTQDERMDGQLLEELRKREEEAAYEEGFPLPDRMGDRQIRWEEKRRDDSIFLFAVFLMAGLAQYGLPDRELKKRMGERERQLLCSYPEFISKLVLLMGAGLPARMAFARMAADHKKRQGMGEVGHVYEELILACREMESGITEVQAYERFGARCRLPQYRKCMTLLAQNLKKGSAGLLSALQEEAAHSLGERIRHAREEGERAGTKLLFPMMMMLTVVMALIMVPACLSFTGM